MAIYTFKGKYVYGDYVSGAIWVLEYNETTHQANNPSLTSLAGSLSSFGEDEAGDIYLLNYQTGKIQQFSTQIVLLIESNPKNM